MPNRRSVLIGMGGLVAAGGAALGTGAFTTVTAERTVSVETAGDGSAFLALAPARNNDNFVSAPSDGTIEINLDGTDSETGQSNGGLNQNAETVFRNLVTITNNGTQEITSLTLTMAVSNASNVVADDTFEFTVSQNDGNSNQATVSNGGNILTGNNSIPGTLGSGSSINFGMIIDLINGGDGNDLPDGATYTLTIEAQTENSNTGN